jgi:hypothetical protein
MAPGALNMEFAVRAKRAVARAKHRQSGGQPRMTSEEITSLVTTPSALLRVLKEAEPADKAEVYSRLALTLTYHPEDRRVVAEMRSKRTCT